VISRQTNGRVHQLMLASPPVNVLDTATLNELADCVESVTSEVAAILLSGDGRCFSAGASVEEHTESAAPAMLEALTRACIAIEQAPVPVAALVHGSCLGGALELVSFCDFVLADSDAVFGVPEIQLAFFPPLACCRLANLCGRQNAAHLVFTGASVDAERAQNMGLVQQIVPRDEWEKTEKRFNRLSAPVLRLAKQAFNQGTGTAEPERLRQLNDLFISELYKTEDVFEGISSFTEKRRPEWKHR